MTSILQTPFNESYYKEINATLEKELEWEPKLQLYSDKVRLNFREHSLLYIGKVLYFDGKEVNPRWPVKTYYDFYRKDAFRRHQRVLDCLDGKSHVIVIDRGDDGKLFVMYFLRERYNERRGNYEFIWAFHEGKVWEGKDRLGKDMEVWGI